MTTATTTTPEIEQYIEQIGLRPAWQAVHADPRWAPLRPLCPAPAQLIPALRRLGLETASAVMAWVDAVSAAMGGKATDYAALAANRSRIDATTLTPVPWSGGQGISDALAAQCLLRPDCKWTQSDAAYRPLTEAQLRAEIELCPVMYQSTFAQETDDCDDYATAALGWMAARGLGNCAIGRCAFQIFTFGAPGPGHAVIAAVTRDEGAGLTVWFWEPQTNTLYRPKTPAAAQMTGQIFADQARVAELLF